ncbi:ROK family protein [Nocardia sp. NPDC003693]
MTALAFSIDARYLRACRVADDVGVDDVVRMPVPSASVWQRCHELLLEAAAGAEVTALGIACAGPIDMAAGVVAPVDIPEWRAGFEIVAAARAAFPAAEVRLALDGVCSVMAERAFGAATADADSLVVSVSDRVCGGIGVGGLAVVGRTGNAGSIGHVLVPGFDEPCDCGGHGCLEAVAGGIALCRWAVGRGWSGRSVADLVRDAATGDSVAAAALTRAGTAMGRAIASVAALLDVDLVVLGGDLAAAGPELWKPLGEAMAAHARLSYLPGLRVIPSPLGDIGVLAGAGVLALTAVG